MVPKENGNFMKNFIISGMSFFALALLAPQTARPQGTMFVSSLGQPATGSAEGDPHANLGLLVPLLPATVGVGIQSIPEMNER